MGRVITCQKCGIKCQGTSGYCRKHLNELKSRRTRQRAQAKKQYQQNKVKYQEKQIASGNVIPPEQAELIYDHYKEPLKKVESGYGYVGTLAQNKERTHVQCHICGHLYKHLAHHVRWAHKTSAKEYKEEFGLAYGSALIGDVTRENFVQGHKRGPYEPGELPPHLLEYNEKVRRGEVKHRVRGSHEYRLELHNKNGTCPEQVLDKIRELGKELGRTPSFDEFGVKYGGRYKYSMKLHFKTFTEAIKRAGYDTTRGEDRTYTKDELLQFLHNFSDKYGRGPTTSDFRRGLMPVARGTYNYHFGTLNHARVEAGMPAIIPLSNGSYVEIPADKFGEYEDYRTRPHRSKYERLKAFSKLVGRS